MPAGLRVWDENGTLVFDTGTRVSRGARRIVVQVSGSVTDDLLLQGTPYWSWMNRYVELPRSVTFSLSGNVLTYTLSASPRNIPNIGAPPVIILYGVR